MSEVRASGSHIDHQYDIADDSLKAFDWLGDLIPPEAIFTKTYAEGGAFYRYVLGGLPNDDSWFTFPAAFLGNAQFLQSFLLPYIAKVAKGIRFCSPWLFGLESGRCGYEQ